MENKQDKSKPRKVSSRDHKPEERKDGSKLMGALLGKDAARSNNTGKTADAITKSSTASMYKDGTTRDKKDKRQMTIVEEELDPTSKRETFGADHKQKKNLKL